MYDRHWRLAFTGGGGMKGGEMAEEEKCIDGTLIFLHDSMQQIHFKNRQSVS
jgi:hypothetical protein